MNRLKALVLVASLAVGARAQLSAATFADDFASDPLGHGWRVFGDTSLFRWNAGDQSLEVTWDSRQPNSFFAVPLGTVVGKDDDFSLGFELRLRDLTLGVTPGKPFSFELALGLVRLEQATAPGFLRGTGADSPNLVEFDYFPDSGFGATVSPTVISSVMQFATSFNFPLELTLDETFKVAMTYTAASRTLRTVMTRNKAPFGPITDVVLEAGFTDFRVDHFAVASYSDAGQDPQFGGSVLAHGSVDDVRFTAPDPPLSALRGGLGASGYEVEFTGRTGWVYALETSGDLAAWQTRGVPTPGTGLPQRLGDQTPPGGRGFYRVRADRLP